MKKRLFAVLLAVLMIASLSTVSAFAENPAAKIGDVEYDTLQAALDVGGDITLLKNVTENVTIASGKTVNLDLNGFTIEGGTVASRAALTNNGGTVIITDSSAEQTGTIKRSDTGGSGSYYTVLNNSGTMTFNGGTVKNKSGLEPPAWSGSSLVCNGPYQSATLIINNGTFSQANFIVVKNDEYGTLTINGGTIVSDTQAVQNWCDATINGGDLTGDVTTCTYRSTNGTTKITDGDINGDIQAIKLTYRGTPASNKPAVTISGTPTITGTISVGSQIFNQDGSFDPNNDDAVVTITGGKFVDSAGNKQDVSDYVPNGMEQAADGSIVVDDASVATIGNIGYLTLQAAVDAANDGDTIVLTKNFTIADDDHITLNKRVTIEGANSGITVTGSGTSSLFTLVGGSEGSTFRNFTINYTTSTRDCAAIYFHYGFDGTISEVTRIQNVNFIGAQTIDTINEEIGILSVYADIDSSVEITDCTFVNFKYAIFINSLDNVTIANNVIDGTKYGGIIIASGEQYPVDNLVIDGNILNDICYANYNDPIYGSGISVGPATTNVNISDNSISMIGDKQAIYIDEDSAKNIYTVIYTVNGAEYYTTYVSANNGQLIYKAPADPSDSSRFIGWNYGRATVNDSNHNRVVITIGSNDGCVNNTYTFSAVWRTVNIPDAYDIDIDDTSNGSISTNLSNASAGATITVTVTPDEGYVLGSLTVTGPDGRVDVTRVNATTYTFKMPEGDVTVDATFVREGLPFADVAANSWYYDAVVYVYNNGLMDGVSSTQFNPDGAMTRAMVWAILARIDGETITGSNWVSEAQSWAVASGVSDGTDANGAVTREQLVTMLWRFAGEPETDATLSAWSDAASVSDWAEAAMAWAVDEGVITGVGASTIDPMGGATRAQCATILMRSIDKI